MTLREAFDHAGELLTPPPALKVWEWAEKRRRFSIDVSARTGRYSVDFAPYQREPQESFLDPDVQVTVLVWAIRMGKTEMVNNLYGSVIEQQAMRILHMTSTGMKAEQYSKQSFMPMVLSTEYLKDVISDSRIQYGTNTILQKQFPGGSISMIGSNSESALRGNLAPIVFCDEVDSYETDEKSGDPVVRAFGRAKNYRVTAKILASTPRWLETSRIWSWYQKSDQRKWFCKCPDCSKFHVLSWSQVKWPAKDRFKETYYECPDCRSKWDDSKRLQAIRAGEWRPTAPFTGIRGYWLNGLNTVFDHGSGFVSMLHQFAKEFHDAYTAGETARNTWQNEFLCEPVEIKGEKVEKQPLLERREKYSWEEVPIGVLVMSIQVDVQQNRLEYEIIGMGESEETWGIEYGILTGNTDGDEVWKELRTIASRTFIRKDGVQLTMDCIAIDHGYRGERVKWFLKRCGIPRAYAVYGSAGRAIKGLIQTNEKKKLVAVNTDAAKDIIFSRLAIPDYGPRFMHFASEKQGYTDRYFTGLTCEEKHKRFKHGFEFWEYRKKASDRNEPLDIRVYFLGAMAKLNAAIPHIKAGIEARAKEKPKEYRLKGPNELAVEKQVAQTRRKRMQFQVPTF